MGILKSNCPSVCLSHIHIFSVRLLLYCLFIDFEKNFSQLLTNTRRSFAQRTQVHSSKVKVTLRGKKDSSIQPIRIVRVRPITLLIVDWFWSNFSELFTNTRQSFACSCKVNATLRSKVMSHFQLECLFATIRTGP